MGRQSAGILVFRLNNRHPEVFLVHPGGPFFFKKDNGSWSIPKGEFTSEEDPLLAAKRELQEETGVSVEGRYIPLSPIKQKGGKIVLAWAVEGNIDPEKIKSNSFAIEWPPRSGKMQEFPEIDKGEWFALPVAKQKINAAQAAWIDELLTKL